MKKSLLIFIFAFSIYNCFAQLPEELLDDLSKNYTIEKIYIHYDKQYYTAGETVWFKAYLMQGFLPASLSTTLNVTLLNDTGKIINNLILPVVGGALAKGNFNLPTTLASGSYTIVANTIHMKNFGPENFYTYSFKIYNSAQSKSADESNDDVSIYFLPEGGNLIAGIPNNIAFKCIDKWGFPVEVSGTITNVEGKSFATFNSTHDGMGIFEIVPKAGENYIANCVLGNGIQKNIPMPVVQAEGVKLNVKRKDGKLYFEIDKSTVVSDSFLPDYLLGVEENTVALKAPLNRGTSSKISGTLPQDNLETGILQLTVFNKMHMPLAERLIFINKEDFNIGADFNSDKKSTAAREKNEFSFTLPDTIKGTYSVSVTDGGLHKVNSSNEENIHTRFLLNNQLKGYIHNASYYLQQNDEKHKQHLDLVMLTNGWRRYSWDEILNKKLPQVTYDESNFISLNGTIKNKSNGVSMGNTEVTAIVKTKKGEANFTDFVNVKSNEYGNFNLQSLIFEDTAKFTFVNSRPDGVPLKVELQPSSQKNNNTVNNYNFRVGKFDVSQSDFAGFISNSFGAELENGITLNTIYLKSVAKKAPIKTADRYASGSIGGIVNTSLDFIKDPPRNGGLNILEYLKSRLPGVNISGRPGNYTVQLRSVISFSGVPPDLSIFIDGMPANTEQASTYSLNDIALVQLYTSGARAGINGALVFYTKKQEDREGKNTDKRETISVNGYSPVKEFYSPNYLLAEDASIIKDARTTLYWNPNLMSDGKNKKVSFSFYNSDKAKKFRIVIEGVTKEGKFLHIVKEIE